MKEYDLIVIGTGSAMNIVSTLLQSRKDLKIAVIEKEQPGGICLTRGCIPSKMILYPAEVVNTIKEAGRYGIEAKIKNIDFSRIMKDMREHVHEESKSIERSLKMSNKIDFYQSEAEFVSDYTLKVGRKKIKGEKIILCTGSRPHLPPIDGLKEIGALTSDTFLKMKSRPKSLTIIGGGYIAAEYGFFLSNMGTKVNIVGRSDNLVAGEEPKVSDVLKKKLSKHMRIYTGYEVKKVGKKGNKKVILAEGDKRLTLESEELLVATGRTPNNDILKPHKSGIKVNSKGWIKVDRYLETSKPNIWAIGDAIGKHMFKHVANYESQVVYRNAFGDGDKISVNYHAVPHAIFTYPEVASVGLGEEEARKKTDVLVGYSSYTDTAKGRIINADDCFVKVIVESSTYKILGAHIIGPYASILIQEIVNLMYSDDGTIAPVYRGMHIHPALSEVVERAFYNLHSHTH